MSIAKLLPLIKKTAYLVPYTLLGGYGVCCASNILISLSFAGVLTHSYYKFKWNHHIYESLDNNKYKDNDKILQTQQ